jgi:hypothetical protein
MVGFAWPYSLCEPAVRQLRHRLWPIASRQNASAIAQLY